MRPLPFLPGFWKLVGTFRDNLFEKAQCVGLLKCLPTLRTKIIPRTEIEKFLKSAA
jgi:hypothetical protein